MEALSMSDVLRVKSRLRDYSVHFVSNAAKALGDQKKKQAFLVIDQDLPGKAKMIKQFSLDRVIQIKADEKNKTLASCTSLIQELVSKNIRRNHVIVAVGGGVIEDVAAFVSMVLFRGIDWIYCPTTLLSQADSCIGSKSSINLGSYKNLLGSFYPPSKIYIDLNFLKTLPKDQVKSGLGEILHFYFVAGRHKLAGEMMLWHDFFLNNPLQLKPHILASLKIKKDVIERDELDRGERNLFNYGHTFGHAIETVTHYRISHGQAVSMGMDMANYLSHHLGYIDEKTFEGMHAILRSNLPSFKLTSRQASSYFQALSKDKKNIGQNVGCILTKGPGRMFKIQVPLDHHFKSLILSYFD
jgi:3-dehydroquinate synthase